MKINAAVRYALQASLDPNAARPYINSRGQPVIAVPTGRRDAANQPIYREAPVGNATLRKDEWVRVDTAVLETAKERLVVVDDMIRLGLTYNVGGLGTIISEYEKVGEMIDASITLDGETQVDMDRVEFNIAGVPIPIIQQPFKVGKRALLASRQRGAGLDVTNAQAAARSVARTSEKLVFLGSPNIGAVDGYSIYGLTNFPGRALASIGPWLDPTYTPEEILGDINGMLQEMETDQFRYGPFYMYVNTAAAFRFREDFKANGDKTLYERVLDNGRGTNAGSISAIRFSDVLPPDQAVLVQMTSDVLDLAVAADLTTIQWSSPSGWTEYFQTYAAWAPRLKSDFNNRVGILHATMGT